MSRPFLAVGLLFVSLASLGCAGVAEEDAGVAGQAIMGGDTDPEDSNVVGIYDLKLNDLCSGSLIAPNVVLTARHCVAPVLGTDVNGGVACGMTTFGANYAPDHFAVTPKENLFDTSADRHVREVVTPKDTAFCGNDVAILILSSSIVAPEARVLVPRVDAPMAAMEGYSAIGYGAIDDAPGGTGAGTRRRRDGLVVQCIGDACPTIFNTPIVAASEWQGDLGVCHGDSGGPSIDNAGRAIGVTSRGASGCTGPVYGDVFSWAQWLKDTTVYAAGLGSFAPPPWATGWPTDPAYSFPVGKTCKKPADCASGRCRADAVGSYCTRLCNDQAPCDDGYTCDAQDQVCVQNPPPPVTKPMTPPKSGGCSVAPCTGSDFTSLVPWALVVLAWIGRRSGGSGPRC